MQKGSCSAFSAERFSLSFQCGKILAQLSVPKDSRSAFSAERFSLSFQCRKVLAQLSMQKNSRSAFNAERFSLSFQCGKVLTQLSVQKATRSWVVGGLVAKICVTIYNPPSSYTQEPLSVKFAVYPPQAVSFMEVGRDGLSYRATSFTSSLHMQTKEWG